MRTGPSRRCSTSSTSSRAGRWPRPSCCCASGAPSCSTRGPPGRRGRSCGRRRWTRRPAAACSARGRRCPSRPSDAWWRGRAATRSSSSSSRPTCASAPRTARCRPPCTSCSPRASTRSTRRSGGSSRRARSKARPSMSAAWRRSCPRSVAPRRRPRSTRWRAASSCAPPSRSSPASAPFASGTRWFATRPTRRCRWPPEPTRTSGWPAGSSTSATRCPTRAPASARSSSAPTAPPASCARRPRGSRRWRTARRGVSPRRPRRCTGAATCRRRSPSSSARWPSWRRATAPAPSCCRPWGPPCSRSAAWSAPSGWRRRRRPAGSIASACAARSNARAWPPTGTPSRWTPPRGSPSPRTPPWRSRSSATTSASRGRAA